MARWLVGGPAGASVGYCFARWRLAKFHESCLQLLRRDFSIMMINVEPAESGGTLDMSNLQIKIPEWDFILGWGAFGSPTDIVMQHLHKTGHKSPRGLCIGGNAVKSRASKLDSRLFWLQVDTDAIAGTAP